MGMLHIRHPLFVGNITINLSRNFSHQIAISADTEPSSGDAFIVDADLQDPPQIITEMIAKWKIGYDMVYGKRSD